jgi:hypothetical protein
MQSVGRRMGSLWTPGFPLFELFGAEDIGESIAKVDEIGDCGSGVDRIRVD